MKTGLQKLHDRAHERAPKTSKGTRKNVRLK